MPDQQLLEDSTRRLHTLLTGASQESLSVLCECAFGRLCDPADPASMVRAIRRSGSNDIMRLLTGRELHYIEIVRKVARKLNITWDPADDEGLLEQKIFLKVFQRAWVKMSEEEREPVRQLFESQGVDAENLSRLLLKGSLVEFMPTIGYLVTLNVARIVAFAVAYETGGVLGAELFGVMLSEALFGPIGIVVGTVIFLANLAGPAYRKTIPAVLQIAYIRQLNKGQAANPTA